MSALLLALALMTAQDSEARATAPDTPARPAGAMVDDYGFVAWCHGALSGYLDLHDLVMPEVTRIESTFRRPGSDLVADLAVYGEMQRLGSKSLLTFERAMDAAETAGPQSLKLQGAAAIQKGRATWSAATATKARLAQEWMSWTLPAACEATAAALEQRARLAAPAPQVDTPPATPASPP